MKERENNLRKWSFFYLLFLKNVYNIVLQIG
jgi:hypothetical protein